VLGLAAALGIAYVIFRLGRRLDLGLFFRVIGVVLMVFAAGLLADAVQGMQELGWLPFGDHRLWDTTRYLNESSNIGDVFHSLLGYADRPTVLQAVVWVTYVTVATTAFIVMGRRARSVPAPVQAPSPGATPATTGPRPATPAGGPAPTSAATAPSGGPARPVSHPDPGGRPSEALPS
jgi:high-affinity iron transporter